MDQFIHVIDAIIVSSIDGKRLYAKYYTNNINENARTQFETNLSSKLKNLQSMADPDIIQIQGRTIIYQIINDVLFQVVGPLHENELVLSEVLDALVKSQNVVLNAQVEARTIMENFELLVLCIDEIVDGGIIIETEGDTVATKVLESIGERYGNQEGEAEVVSQAKDALKSVSASMSGIRSLLNF
jgi:hypothetical protein